MIRLEVIDNGSQQFVLRTDEPARFEVSVIDGKIIMHAYQGVEVDMDQDPVGAYDGTLGDNNLSWETGGPK